MKEKIAIGKILKPHGVRGDFVFLSYSGVLDKNLYSTLYLFMQNDYRSVSISRVSMYKPSKKWFLLQLEDIDRNFLETARGLEIFIEQLPYESLKEGEFFYRDLEGCDVFYKELFLGKVVMVHNFSGPDTVEVLYLDPKNNKERSLFLPLKEPFLVSLDTKDKKIIFEEIDGFL